MMELKCNECGQDVGKNFIVEHEGMGETRHKTMRQRIAENVIVLCVSCDNERHHDLGYN